MTGEQPRLIWAMAVSAIGAELKTARFASGTIKARVGRWRLTYNNSAAVASDWKIPPFGVRGVHEESSASFLAMPFEGSTVGYPEERLIGDLERFMSPPSLELYAEDIASARASFESNRKGRK